MYHCLQVVSLYYQLLQISNLLLSIKQNGILFYVFFKHFSRKILIPMNNKVISIQIVLYMILDLYWIQENT